MYRKLGQNPISPENFELTFEGKLSSDNRWVVLASLIPWGEFEEEILLRENLDKLKEDSASIE
jgi:hypothetical protein